MSELNVYDSLDMRISQETYLYDKDGNMTERCTYSGYSVLEDKAIIRYDEYDWCGNYRKALLYDKDSTLSGGTFRTIEYY